MFRVLKIIFNLSSCKLHLDPSCLNMQRTGLDVTTMNNNNVHLQNVQPRKALHIKQSLTLKESAYMPNV